MRRFDASVNAGADIFDTNKIHVGQGGVRAKRPNCQAFSRRCGIVPIRLLVKLGELPLNRIVVGLAIIAPFAVVLSPLSIRLRFMPSTHDQSAFVGAVHLNASGGK